ncbi:hypothetical protein ACLKA7_005667 [Drosophila subpalustris]
MTSEVYVKEGLQKRLLPFIRKDLSPVKFWPDLATCHYSNTTRLWYEANKVDVLPKMSGSNGQPPNKVRKLNFATNHDEPENPSGT